MKRLLYLSLLPVGVALIKLLRFILEPDYIPGYMDRNKVVRCDGGEPEKYDAWMWIK